jgi:hypothetical protein
MERINEKKKEKKQSELTAISSHLSSILLRITSDDH